MKLHILQKINQVLNKLHAQCTTDVASIKKYLSICTFEPKPLSAGHFHIAIVPTAHLVHPFFSLQVNHSE
jgi:hypothetical protein